MERYSWAQFKGALNCHNRDGSGKFHIGGVNAFEIKCDKKIFKISWTEHRTNKSIGKEFKMEDQWLEIFINKQKLKY